MKFRFSQMKLKISSSKFHASSNGIATIGHFLHLCPPGAHIVISQGGSWAENFHDLGVIFPIFRFLLHFSLTIFPVKGGPGPPGPPSCAPLMPATGYILLTWRAIFFGPKIFNFFSLFYVLDHSSWCLMKTKNWSPFLTHSVHGVVPGLWSQPRYL